jgi:hypothetical protein
VYPGEVQRPRSTSARRWDLTRRPNNVFPAIEAISRDASAVGPLRRWLPRTRRPARRSATTPLASSPQPPSPLAGPIMPQLLALRRRAVGWAVIGLSIRPRAPGAVPGLSGRLVNSHWGLACSIVGRASFMAQRTRLLCRYHAAKTAMVCSHRPAVAFPRRHRVPPPKPVRIGAIVPRRSGDRRPSAQTAPA